MKYLMLVCWDAEKMDDQTEPDPTDTPNEESFPWLDDLQARGTWVTGDQLAPPRRARSFASATGKRWSLTVRSPRPRRRWAGFDVLECGSLEEAVEIAAGHPVAQTGTIEVRPSGELTGRHGAGCSRSPRSSPVVSWRR
jgi:hypothetical protein